MKATILPFDGIPGTVFGLVRILGKRNEHRERLAEIVAEHIERFHATTTEQINIPRRFEQILQAINEDIHAYASNVPSIPLNDFHAVVGVRIKHQLFLSGIGSLSALFLHRTAKQRYVIYELDKQFNESPSWEKPFITVLDGELHPGDVFYIATRVSPKEITIGELQDVLITLPPSGALKRIQQYLNRDTAYGAVALQVRDKEESGAPKKINPTSSMKSFSDTTEQTATLLGEQGPEIGNAITRFISPLMKKLSAPGTKGPKTIFKRTLKAIIKLLAALAAFTAAFLKKTFQFTSQTIKTIRAKKTQGRKEPSEKKEKRPLLTRVKEWGSKLPKRSYLIAGGVALAAVLLVAVIIGTSMNNATREQEETIQTIIKRAEDKKNAAEASLIYDDVDQARTLVAEALALIDTLPQTDDDLREATNELRDELNDVLAQIRGVNLVTTNQLGDLASAAQGSVIGIDQTEGSVHAITSDNQVLKFNELEQRWEEVQLTLGTIAPARLSAEESGDLLVVDENKTLARVNFTNGTLNPVTSGAGGLESVEDIEVYNANLYALTSAGKQIVRMRPQLTNYDAGTLWINSANIDLSNAVDMTIDGDIYVLTSNTVAKFSSGSEQSFSLVETDPTLQGASKIWTSAESSYLYILDPGEGRVLVFEKDGALTTQYFAEEFKNAADFVIREDQNSIVVLAASQAHTFAAEHLLR